VKPKPVTAIFARAIALCLSSFDSTSAQALKQPTKSQRRRFGSVRSRFQRIKLEQKTKYGLVTSTRSAGSVVKVISLESDSLKIESDGFLGAVNVDKTDFWHRAEKTRDAAIEKQNREQALAKEREEREFEEKMRAARLQWYEDARVLQLEIIQVLNDGCLARVLNENLKRIFIELRGANLAQGQRYEVRAEQKGTFKYTTVLGASSVVERWAPLAKP